DPPPAGLLGEQLILDDPPQHGPGPELLQDPLVVIPPGDGLPVDLRHHLPGVGPGLALDPPGLALRPDPAGFAEAPHERQEGRRERRPAEAEGPAPREAGGKLEQHLAERFYARRWRNQRRLPVPLRPVPEYHGPL